MTPNTRGNENGVAREDARGGPLKQECADLEIRHDIPLPPRSHGRGPDCGAIAKAFKALAVGESFVYPMTIRNDMRVTQTYAGRTGQALKPKKFSTRIVEEGGKRVVRIWRVA